MTRLFKRAWGISVNDGREQRDFDLDLRFTIVKTNDSTPNEGEIQILNMGRDSRGFVDRRNLQVVLRAGYEGEIGEIFRGNTELVRNGPSLNHSGTEWESNLFCLDGGTALRNLFISQSFKSGTDVRTVIDKILKSLTAIPPGLDQELAKINQLTLDAIKLESFKPVTPNVKGKKKTTQQQQIPDIERQQREYLQKAQAAQQAALKKTLAKSEALRGSAINKLRYLTDSLGLNVTINNQSISIRPKGLAASGDLIVISQDSGMVGKPVKVDNGWEVISLLRHEFEPGLAVVVESLNEGSGVLFIQRVEHTGDTRGQEWHSKLFLQESSA
jgi:hypothetical protein